MWPPLPSRPRPGRGRRQEARVDPLEIAAALIVEARAVETGEAGVRVGPSEGAVRPSDVLVAVWASFPDHRHADARAGLVLAWEALEDAARETAGAEGRPRTDVFDAALAGLLASAPTSRRDGPPAAREPSLPAWISRALRDSFRGGASPQ